MKPVSPPKREEDFPHHWKENAKELLSTLTLFGAIFMLLSLTGFMLSVLHISVNPRVELTEESPVSLATILTIASITVAIKIFLENNNSGQPKKKEFLIRILYTLSFTAVVIDSYWTILGIITPLSPHLINKATSKQAVDDTIQASLFSLKDHLTVQDIIYLSLLSIAVAIAATASQYIELPEWREKLKMESKRSKFEALQNEIEKLSDYPSVEPLKDRKLFSNLDVIAITLGAVSFLLLIPLGAFMIALERFMLLHDNPITTILLGIVVTFSFGFSIGKIRLFKPSFSASKYWSPLFFVSVVLFSILGIHALILAVLLKSSPAVVLITLSLIISGYYIYLLIEKPIGSNRTDDKLTSKLFRILFSDSPYKQAIKSELLYARQATEKEVQALRQNRDV